VSLPLDDLIKQRAKIYADHLTEVASKAKKEEEIRIASEHQLAFLQQAAGIKLEGKHEFTVASGFVDSVYDRVIIEYKNPNSVGGRLGPTLESPGTKKVLDQIKSRFADLNAQHGQPLTSLFGVGMDGRYFVFVRFRNGQWSVQDPVPVTQHSAERFLRALFNLGTKGKAFTPSDLAQDFGADGEIASAAIRSLYDALLETQNPKALILFNEWKIHFSEVCGYDVDEPSEKIIRLAESYGLASKGVKAANLLFSLHTYYALFMKLLAAELVSSVHQLPGGTPLRKMMQAVTSAKMRRELEDLEAGSVFRHFNITNFLEGDLFAWYIQAWSPAMDGWIRSLVSKLDSYNPGTLSEDPAESRDLLKKLYHQLFPRSVRHDLGEYYTPDWLADHLLNKLAYDGNPDIRLLDPACGSGTFLVMAIARIRKWYEENRESCSFDEEGLCRKILANVIGFDLNPLAVMAARTNYLIAIRDLVGHMDGVEIPIYLCDAIMTPSEHGGLFAGALDKARDLKTAAGTFIIPTEIAQTQAHIARYAELLEECVRDKYAPEEFILRCKEEKLSVKENLLHTDLFTQLVKLDAERRNGVWARIIKNAFAPLFTPQVDFIVGNPPWVNWESLPDMYRKSTAKLWTQYDLFRQKGLNARLGGAKDDISILMTYVCHDAYLKPSGKLGFVITQSVFKTKGGGEGFRGFRYTRTGNAETHMAPLEVEDLSSLQPFEGATNRTAIFTVGKSAKPVAYPVPYVLWNKHRRAAIAQDSSLKEVFSKVDRLSQVATPVEKTDLRSPWITASAPVLKVLSTLRGQGRYSSRKGVYCATNAVYWLTKSQKGTGKTLVVTNLADSGKKQLRQVTTAVESTFVHDLVRGKDVGRWNWDSEIKILLPQDPAHPSTAVPTETLKVKFPKTFAYFKGFEKEIRACALLAQFFDPTTDPFYSSYNVGTYTYAPFKVVWKEICQEIEAVVIEDPGRSVIPDHKLVMVAFDKAEPAYFLSGLLNSIPVGLFVRSYAVQTSISGHIFDYVAFPQFDSKDSAHRDVAKYARDLHSAKASDVVDLEERLDQAVALVLTVPQSHLKLMRKELQILRGGAVAKAA
jgi:SAM-dependent methyltransferase